jgi:CspA family cold shock protein
MLGTVKWFDSGKGYGFVAGDDGGSDIFLGAGVIRRIGMAEPADGARVMVLVVEGAKGREAISVAPVL